MEQKESKERRLGKALRGPGTALALPMVMVSFPLIGAVVGKYLAEKFDKPWIIVVSVAIGLALAVRECIRLLRQMNRVEK